MAKKKPVSTIVGAERRPVSGEVGAPRSSHSVTAPGPLSADARGGAHAKPRRSTSLPFFPELTAEDREAEMKLAVYGPAARITVRFKLPGHGLNEAYEASISTGATREAVKAALCVAVDRAFESEGVWPTTRRLT